MSECRRGLPTGAMLLHRMGTPNNGTLQGYAGVATRTQVSACCKALTGEVAVRVLHWGAVGLTLHGRVRSGAQARTWYRTLLAAILEPLVHSWAYYMPGRAPAPELRGGRRVQARARCRTSWSRRASWRAGRDA